MTLHEAIEKLLRHAGHSMTTQEIALELNKNGWYQKKDKSPIHETQIRRRVFNYAHIFMLHGSVVSLREQSFNEKTHDNSKKEPRRNSGYSVVITNIIKSDNDEQYVLDLCDKVLGLKSSRQHKFDFLLGDKNKKGEAAKLPVDGYYEELGLVVEYHEKQHTESTPFFDKPDKMTVSGVSRSRQREMYDERRRQVLPKHGITLIEISYSDFMHNKQKRIIRDKDLDEKIIRRKLSHFIDISSTLKR